MAPLECCPNTRARVNISLDSLRADRLKILLWDGTGLVLIYKRLGRAGRFEWPQISGGVMHLTRVQFEALFDGLNWKRVGERIVATPAAAN